MAMLSACPQSSDGRLSGLGQGEPAPSFTKDNSSFCYHLRGGRISFYLGEYLLHFIGCPFINISVISGRLLPISWCFPRPDTWDPSKALSVTL